MSIYFVNFDKAVGTIQEVFYPTQFAKLVHSALHEHGGILCFFSKTYSLDELNTVLHTLIKLEDFERVEIICRNNNEANAHEVDAHGMADHEMDNLKKQKLAEWRPHSDYFYFFDDGFDWVTPSSNKLKKDKFYRVYLNEEGIPRSPLYLNCYHATFPYNEEYLDLTASWIKDSNSSSELIEQYYKDSLHVANRMNLIVPGTATIFGIGGVVQGIVLAKIIMATSSVNVTILVSVGMALLFCSVTTTVGALFGISIREGVAYCSKPKTTYLEDMGFFAPNDNDMSATDSDDPDDPADLENGLLPAT